MLNKNLLVSLLLLVVTVVPAEFVQAEIFDVTTYLDGPDDDLTDGICKAKGRNSRCTLRAAIMQANVIEHEIIEGKEVAHIIRLPVYELPYVIGRLNGGDDDGHDDMGDFDISTSMSIQRSPKPETEVKPVISGAGNPHSYRLFQVHNNPDKAVSVTFDNVEFINGGGLGKKGGVILFEDDDGELVVSNSSFSNNTMTAESSSGGAIYLTAPNGHVSISASSFTNSSVLGNGGAIYMTVPNGHVSISASSFTDNSALSSGGAIYTTAANGRVSFTASSFTNNSAFSSGGAIYTTAANGRVSITGSSFTNNSALISGGAATLFSSVTIEERIYYSGTEHIEEPSNFSGNSAQLGGAIYLGDIGSRTRASISKANFSMNSADGDLGRAGALYVEAGIGYLEVEETSFDNNSAGDIGGAMVAYSDFVKVMKSTFDTNDSGNFAGAIDMANNIAQIEGTTFTNNFSSAAGAVRIRDSETGFRYSQFNENRANDGSGGAIVAYTDSATFFDGVSFYNNSATIDCGAIDVDSSKPGMELKIFNSLFDANVALDGGGICADAMVFLVNSTLNANVAANYGGAIMLTGLGDLDIESSTFNINEAGIIGAHIYDDVGQTTSRGSLFSATNVDSCNIHIQSDGDNIGPHGNRCGFNIVLDKTLDAGEVIGLDELADYGGQTNTLALLGSENKAEDQGSLEATCPALDQRGFYRDDSCDVGAYERQKTEEVTTNSGKAKPVLISVFNVFTVVEGEDIVFTLSRSDEHDGAVAVRLIDPVSLDVSATSTDDYSDINENSSSLIVWNEGEIDDREVILTTTAVFDGDDSLSDGHENGMSENDEALEFDLVVVHGHAEISETENKRIIIEKGPGQIGFVESSVEFDEDGGALNIEIFRRKSKGGSFAVMASTQEISGLAEEGVDFEALNQEVKFEEDDATSQVINVKVLDNTLDECINNKRFKVVLSGADTERNSVNLEPIDPDHSEIIVTIIDDDLATDTLVAFDSDNYNVREGSSIDITISRTGNLCLTDYVYFGIADVDSVDIADVRIEYLGAEGRGLVKFNDDESVKTMRITSEDDSLVEGNKSFTLMMSKNQDLSSAKNAMITITDDDVAGEVEEVACTAEQELIEGECRSITAGVADSGGGGGSSGGTLPVSLLVAIILTGLLRRKLQCQQCSQS